MIRSNGELSMRMLRKLAGRLNEAQFRVSVLQMRNTMGRVMLQLQHEVKALEAGNKATVPEDLDMMLGLDKVELEDIMDRLVAKNLIKLENDGVFSIVDDEEYARFMSYLELRDKYEFVNKL